MSAREGKDEHGEVGKIRRLFPVCAAVAAMGTPCFCFVVFHFGRLVFSGKWLPLAIEAVLFFTFSALVVHCFVNCLYVDPGSIPSDGQWDLREEPADPHAGATSVRRQCKWCLKYKPDRCHHCRICNRCVLRMDHHCRFVDNCIGYRNYKYFFLLVVYSICDLVFIAVAMFDTLWWSTRIDVSVVMMALLLVAEIFACFLGGLLVAFAGFHLWLLKSAMTSLEYWEKFVWRTSADGTEVSKFDMGSCYQNVCTMLGSQPWLWLVPTAPKLGEGVAWGGAGTSEGRS